MSGLTCRTGNATTDLMNPQIKTFRRLDRYERDKITKPVIKPKKHENKTGNIRGDLRFTT